MNSRRYVVCDIEATGLDQDSEIIEIALITYQDGKIVDVYETLINPMRPLPNRISELTSISRRSLEVAPKFYDVAESIRLRLEGNIFVAHNIDFDLNLLKKKFLELGISLKLKTFCTLKVAIHEVPGLSNYNLDALCAFFGIKIRDRHRAIGDAYATLDLFKELFKLRLKVYPKKLYLPHHERILKDIPKSSGLLRFKNKKGQLLRMEAALNMEERARYILEAKYENRELLEKVTDIEFELTGSLLIAEFKKLLFYPIHINWMIECAQYDSGEKYFKIRPFKKNSGGLWYFKEYTEAKRKLNHLNHHLKKTSFVYRDLPMTKDEILEHNKKVQNLMRRASFPHQDILIIGQGRTIGEKSIVLIRHGHVLGYGYGPDNEIELSMTPDSFIEKRFFNHFGADLAAQNHLRVLKNMKNKAESWRTLSAIV